MENNVMKEEKEKLNVTITSQVYMDDVTWITHDKKSLEQILSIADEFNKLNNIKVNYDKFALATNTKIREENNTVTLRINDKKQSITPVKTNESVRILGVWVNLDMKPNFVFNQCLDIVQSYNKIIKKKQVIDSQMKYIINHVIIPRIEYKAQLNIFNEVQINKINSQIRSMFKQ